MVHACHVNSHVLLVVTWTPVCALHVFKDTFLLNLTMPASCNLISMDCLALNLLIVVLTHKLQLMLMEPMSLPVLFVSKDTLWLQVDALRVLKDASFVILTKLLHAWFVLLATNSIQITFVQPYRVLLVLGVVILALIWHAFHVFKDWSSIKTSNVNTLAWVHVPPVPTLILSVVWAVFKVTIWSTVLAKLTLHVRLMVLALFAPPALLWQLITLTFR